MLDMWHQPVLARTDRRDEAVTDKQLLKKLSRHAKNEKLVIVRQYDQTSTETIAICSVGQLQRILKPQKKQQQREYVTNQHSTMMDGNLWK